MLVAFGKMRWVAAVLVVAVLFTLCGCHSAIGMVFCAIGTWLAEGPLALNGIAGFEVLVGVAIVFTTYMSTLGVDSAVAGNVCDLTAAVDTDGDGVGDMDLDLHGPWQLDGDRVDLMKHPAMDVPALIAELDALRKQGALSDEEFEAKKAELLARL